MKHYLDSNKIKVRIITDCQQKDLDVDEICYHNMFELYSSKKDLEKISDVFINPNNPQQLIATSKGRLLSIQILSEMSWVDLDYYYGK